MPRRNTNVSPTKSWDTESAPDHFDGRKNIDPDEADENGKWNKIKSRPAVIVSKWNIRKAGGQ